MAFGVLDVPPQSFKSVPGEKYCHFLSAFPGIKHTFGAQMTTVPPVRGGETPEGVEQTGATLSGCSTGRRQAVWDGTIFTVPILLLITSLSDG